MQRRETRSSFRPRALSVVAALGLAASACASDDRPFLLPADVVQAAPATTSTIPPPSTTLDPGTPLALLTPTGVVVPILDITPTAYLVQSPCQAEVEIVYGTPIYQVDIVLDPGHGGEVETGAVGPNGLTEKDLNLRLAKLAARKLEARGISVALTRTADYRLPIQTRSQIADTLKAQALISIHHNAPVLTASSEPGSEVFYQSRSLQSARLGGLVQEEILDALRQFDGINWVAARDAGVVAVLKPDGTESYGMIRRPDTPAVLAEFGYIANQSEADLFDTPEYLDAAAEAITAAAERYLTTDDTGVAPNPVNRTFTPTGGTGGVDNCEDPALE
ncbi:MAG: N-acetylmuramoyl-L-alanine amidase [Acidimicrobiales bacterium]|nr:N-acetylmuramoyl-L-alanine amidase [Acidimicrobiales bacterium]